MSIVFIYSLICAIIGFDSLVKLYLIVNIHINFNQVKEIICKKLQKEENLEKHGTNYSRMGQVKFVYFA